MDVTSVVSVSVSASASASRSDFSAVSFYGMVVAQRRVPPSLLSTRMVNVELGELSWENRYHDMIVLDCNRFVSFYMSCFKIKDAIDR
jgi:hypothetical protein